MSVKRDYSFTVRLSDSERADLEALALYWIGQAIAREKLLLLQQQSLLPLEV